MTTAYAGYTEPTQEVLHGSDVAHSIIDSLVNQFGPWLILGILILGAWQLFKWKRGKHGKV